MAAESSWYGIAKMQGCRQETWLRLIECSTANTPLLSKTCITQLMRETAAMDWLWPEARWERPPKSGPSRGLHEAGASQALYCVLDRVIAKNLGISV